MMYFTLQVPGFEPLETENRVQPGLEEYHIPGSRIISGAGAFGCYMMQVIQLNGFAWSYNIFKPLKDMAFNISLYTPVVICRISLKGHLEHELNALGRFRLRENQYQFFCCNFLGNSFHLKKGHLYVSVDINYPLTFLLEKLIFFPGLHEFEKNVASSQPCKLPETGISLSASMIHLLHSLIHSPFSENVRKFHLDILKEFLLKGLENIATVRQPGKGVMIDEIDRIYAAKEFIDSNLPRHFNISVIAKKAGINEKKLKKAFREVFGIGLYGYLREQIFRIAKIQLEQTRKSIKEISFYAGYKKANNFSAVFKKRFGVTPSEYRKSVN